MRFGAVGALSLPRSSFPINPRLRYSLSNGGTSLHFPNFISSRRFSCHCTSSRAPSLELPLLPFVLDEVLVPSEAKTLHLYEARFLALLEEAVSQSNKTFVHFVLDPVSNSRFSYPSYCSLIHIENIEKLPIGALVSIRGISRVNVVELVQMEPYLRGVVVPVLDNVPSEATQLNSKVLELKDSISSLQALQIKLKVPKRERLQTQTKNSLFWAENEVSGFSLQDFVPTQAERISFSAFQPVAGMSDTELLTVQRERLKAMELRESLERVERGITFVRQCMKMVAARLAIQSL
ncbi:ATP-dependent protease La (LON) domain protein [Rhynchospora pubera]|uniref:ATP-dependent protease La (LON) domain protein n=1 Tax=Rhynchospora pubera TaxID=906938 RepID=A0AAV8FT73_9POAL|nr:ATP-dependent protease La (LON) domain protein [Rhynchospora pubera]